MQELPVVRPEEARPRLPSWIRARFPGGPNYLRLKALMREEGLHTVCEEARCPNIGECWGHGTATFMILGEVCTRGCRYCAVAKGMPTELDLDEPRRLAEAVVRMGLSYVVVTSVDRDDLADGGAAIFAASIREIRRLAPGTTVEVLIPDFQGNPAALRAVLEAGPEVLNHNVETVPRLQRPVRRRARWDRSVHVLTHGQVVANEIGFDAMVTKTGMMLGLGETWDEILEAMRLLREADIDVLTIGQYLRPSRQHLPLTKYYTPAEFMSLRRIGLEMGFKHVQSGPLVRSSYHAAEQVPGSEAAAAS